ncbi:MAG: universal stress protein [Thermonemataceae bacterium]
MKSIFVPTDFSEYANNALTYALSIAKEASNEAEVVLLNAYQVPYSTSTIRSDKIYDVLEEGSKSGLDNLAAQYTDTYPDVKITTKTYKGDLKNYVNTDKFAEQYDLVVMGTKGASSLENVIFGSTTTSILEKSKVPVLAIPANAAYSSIKSIAYASDYLKEDLQVISKLVDIAQSFEAAIKVVHVIEKDYDDFEEMVRFKGFEAVVSDTIGFENITFDKVISDDFDQGLKKYMSEQEVSLLAMTTHKRSFLAKLLVPSLTKMITMHAEVPVISFRV